MPEYMVVIDKGGLDTVTEIPAGAAYKSKPTDMIARKAGLVIGSFEREEIEDPKNPSATAMRAHERIVKGVTKAGMNLGQALSMMNMRAMTHSGGDYLQLKVKMPASEMKRIRSMDSHDGALEAMMRATTVMHGRKDDFPKWMKRMELEKEMK